MTNGISGGEYPPARKHLAILTRPGWQPMLLGLAILSHAALPTATRAQVNIEKLRASGADAGLAFETRLELASRSGNVDITTLGVDIRVDVTGGQRHSFVLARGSFGWKDSSRFSNEGLVHLRHTHFRMARVGIEAFAQLDYDKSRLLDFRGITGAGARIRVYDGASGEGHLGSGYMVEHERYDLAASAQHPDEETDGRWTNYISVTIGEDKRIAFSTITYVQPRLSDFGDLRVLTEATLVVELAEPIKLHNTFRARYDSRPPGDIEDLDTQLTSGVVLTF